MRFTTYGFNTAGIHITRPLSLLKQRHDLYDLYVKHIEQNNLPENTGTCLAWIDSLCWDGSQKGFWSFFASMIWCGSNIEFKYGKTAGLLLLQTDCPWGYCESERELTQEDVDNLLLRYLSVVTDDRPVFRKYSFEIDV